MGKFTVKALYKNGQELKIENITHYSIFNSKEVTKELPMNLKNTLYKNLLNTDNSINSFISFLTEDNFNSGFEEDKTLKKEHVIFTQDLISIEIY